MNTVYYRLADATRHTVTLHRSGRHAVMHVDAELLAAGETGYTIITTEPAPPPLPRAPDNTLAELRKQFYPTLQNKHCNTSDLVSSGVANSLGFFHARKRYV